MNEVLSEYWIRVVTPFFIGNDQTVSPISYMSKGGFLHVYDSNNVAKFIKNPLKIIDQSIKSLRLSSLLSKEDLEKIVPLRKIEIFPRSSIEGQEIDLTITENNEYYIPGSSLKGAIKHAIEFSDKTSVEIFKNSFVISDTYFTSVESRLQKGWRVTTNSSSKNSGNKQSQDNFKEWVTAGESQKLKAYFRRDVNIDILNSIYKFSKLYFEYQKSYFEYLLDNVSHSPIETKHLNFLNDLLDDYLELNTKDNPLLLIGGNTHRYSKSFELEKNKTYRFTSGKMSAHPLSRLLVLDNNKYFTLPGIIEITKYADNS